MRLQRHRRGRPGAAVREELEGMVERHLTRDGAAMPVPDLLAYLDLLADLDRFAFHGSNVAGLRELRTERQSSDTRAFGRQGAVYATPDPHWAAFFAIVDRSNATSIHNASLALSPAARSRWYLRDVVVRDPGALPLRTGWLYVLARDTFHAEGRLFGVLDTAQWVSRVPVTPLFGLELDPRSYPLARHIRTRPQGRGRGTRG